MTSIAEQLSSVRGDRCQDSNKQLAELIADTSDTVALTELADLAASGPKAISTDAIKVIGEISLRNPDLIEPHIDSLIAIAESGKGVHLWESLTALAAIAESNPDAMATHWRVFESGVTSESVIARDQSVKGLCALADADSYEDCMPVLVDVLEHCPVNQFPTYAEQIARVVRPNHVPALIELLERRVGEMPNAAKSKRVSKLIQRLS